MTAEMSDFTLGLIVGGAIVAVVEIVLFGALGGRSR